MADRPIFLKVGAGGAVGAGASDAAALKERSASALEAALAFVDAGADELASLRARVILEAEPADRLVQALAARQNSDGSFPEIEGSGEPTEAREGFAAPAVVRSALGWLADLRKLHTEPAQRAEAWLQGAQNADGSWGPETAPAADRLPLTGSLAGILGRSRSVRPSVLDGAADFLAALWSPERIEGSPCAVVAAFAAFFTNVHHELADEALQWCGRELERATRTRRFEAAEVARVLMDCDAAALPAFGVSPMELVALLLDEQAADGGFAELATGGAGARIGATVDAMLAIVRLNRAFR